MSGRSVEKPPSNSHVEAIGTPSPVDDLSSVADGSQMLVVSDGYRLEPAAVRSNYGKIGEIAKRVVARLIRFHTHEQAAINEAQRSEIEHLRLRLALVEAASQQRFAMNERELIALQRDLTAAAADFARIAERMPALENARRIVSRLAPFRSEVRAHRRSLMELRQHFASLSARLTLVQREIAPSRKLLDALRAELDAALASLRADLERRHTGLAGEDALLKRAETIFESVRREEAALSAAIAEHGVRLGGAMEEIARLGRAVDDPEASARLARAESRITEIASEIGGVTDGLKRIAGAEARMADIAGAVNSLAGDFIRDKQERGSLGDPAQIVNGIPDVAQRRIGDIAGRMDVLAADLANLRRRLLATPYVSTPLGGWTPSRLSTPSDFDYLGFEDVFRGPEALVRERMRVYVELLREHAPIVELGSGRGELLELMREAKLKTTGVEINADAVERCRSKGLRNVVTSDANAYLESLPERSVGAIFSAQFAEHLSFTDLLRCLALSRSRLVEGGLFVAETVNPNSIEAAKTFFVDPSHVKPLFPEVFAFVCRSVGFTGVRLFYPSGGGFDEQDPASQHEYAVVATV